ncbi:S-adenosyl-L-methionine-dependent methyltransferase [Artomyces pyxidatus]|uniref:S-adenosyl-L-methionine-dependent methyltransferase n=1 Tax=Artomyces pyxidatus TaxID=48021 RepID=A0ACB8SUM4_9AGAM|nr:S-adenosyl-L-methionine-dependent methyltransferase [Artomyces pyxidatus]
MAVASIDTHVASDRDASGWSASAYRAAAPFVYAAAFTAPILTSLDARPGERIVDFGCGSGEVTKEIVNLVGHEGEVVGIDISENMIAKARETTGLPETHLLVADVQSCEFLGSGFPSHLVGSCDKVFSNAALHWCSRDPRGAAVSAARLLKQGGLFVGEMGGQGNCSGLREAMHTVLQRRGIDAAARDPWFFPSADEYGQVLVSAGLKPIHASLHPRPTPVENLAAWIRLFTGHNFLEGMSPDEEASVVREVVDICQADERCWDEEGSRWCMNYVRLRFVAVKE